MKHEKLQCTCKAETFQVLSEDVYAVSAVGSRSKLDMWQRSLRGKAMDGDCATSDPVCFWRLRSE